MFSASFWFFSIFLSAWFLIPSPHLKWSPSQTGLIVFLSTFPVSLVSVSPSSLSAFASSPYNLVVNVARSHLTPVQAVSTFGLFILITTVDFRHTHMHAHTHTCTHAHTCTHTHTLLISPNITVASQQVFPVYWPWLPDESRVFGTWGCPQFVVWGLWPGPGSTPLSPPCGLCSPQLDLREGVCRFCVNFVSLKGMRGLPGGSVIKSSPCNAEGVGSTPGQGAQSHMPRSQETKNRSNKGFKKIKSQRCLYQRPTLLA